MRTFEFVIRADRRGGGVRVLKLIGLIVKFA